MATSAIPTPEADAAFRTALIIEDHPLFGDALAMTLQSVSGIETVMHAENLTQAAGMLTEGASFDVVLLDLNLPDVDGREVLQAIRSNPQTQSLPVVVLSTSREPDDVQSTYALHANSYIQKPLDFQKFLWAVQQVAIYWLVLNLPGTGGNGAALG